ncbi:hypothetical protein [Niallia sp. 03133]|uniref:hypothetical protein n=1 Tax=Niallia sp. 03133 TaxID=3458060 RepID=UPI0040448462
MCQQSNFLVEEENLKTNVLKTIFYLFDSVCEEDYETVDLELEELNAAVSRLRDFHSKRDRNHKLVDLVEEMKEKGIKIDFAKRAFFLHDEAKNAAESGRTIHLDKKKQQA